jgi:hypothetical protein
MKPADSGINAGATSTTGHASGANCANKKLAERKSVPLALKLK